MILNRKVLPVLAAQLNSHWIISLCLCKFPLQLKRHRAFFFHWLQLSSLTQLHFNGSEVIPLYYSYFAKSIWCEVDKKDNIADSPSRTSSIILWTSRSTIFMSLHHWLTPPCWNVRWQEHSQCPPSSSAIRSSASCQPRLSRTRFLSKSQKCHYIMGAGGTLMWVFSHQAAKVPHGSAATDFGRDWWHRDVGTPVPPEPQAIRWTFAANMAWAMNHRAALPTVGSCFISGNPYWRTFTNASETTSWQTRCFPRKTETHPLLFSSVFTVYFCWAWLTLE